MTTVKKYWAFLSYSHQDDKTCAWLHQSLERYAVPKRLVGRDGRNGSIPSRLFPVFRDRDELPGSAELGANLTDALSSSRCLIVLCSPASARSRWVNEEIRQFKRMGGEDRILALILDGEPNASDKPDSGLLECFPETLKFRVNAGGELTDQRVEPIAADIRKGKETRQIALLKLISGLLGVPFDELRQRDRERKRRQFVWRTAAALTLVAAVTAALVVRYRSDRMERLEDLGREALLKNQPTQAAVYLAAAYEMGRSTPELRVMLDQAMRSVDALVTVHSPPTAGGRFSSVAYDSGGARLLATLETGETINWRSDNGGLLVTLPSIETNNAQQARYFDEGRVIVALTPDKAQRFKSRDGKKLEPFVWPPGFAPLPPEQQPNAGSRIFLTSTDGRIRVADLAARTTDPNEIRDCSKVVMSKDTLVCTKSRSLEIFPLTRSIAPAKPKTITFAANIFMTTAGNNEDVALVVLADGVTNLVDLTSGRIVSEVRHPGGVEAAGMSRDGSMIVTGGSTGSVLLWSRKDGRLLAQLPAHAGRVREVAFLVKDERVVTVGEDNLIKVWDTATGALLSLNDAGHGPGIRSLVSPKRDQLVTYSLTAGGTIKVWDLTAAGPIALFKLSPANSAAQANSSKDDTRCETRVRRQLNADGSLSVIDSKTSNERLRLGNGVDTVEAELACDPKLDWLVTGGRSGAALLWNAATAKPAGRFVGHTQSITGVSFVDANTFATTAKDGTAARWSFEPESRSPEIISRRVACRVPFTLLGYSLRGALAETRSCQR